MTAAAGLLNRRHRLALDSGAADKPPSPPPIMSTRTISPRTLNRRNLRQGRETGPAGMMASLRDWGQLEVIHSLDSDHTKNPLASTDHPPRDSMNRLSSNPASTPSADVGPICSTFKASAAWRIAREARSRTDKLHSRRIHRVVGDCGAIEL